MLGPDFRFHTKIYRTGDLGPHGILNGDLVLGASGDPNLSGRLRPDGALAFEDEDHSYDSFADARPVPGDPLLVIRELAAKVAAAGVKKVRGRVLVDTLLFAEGARKLGTGVVLSPIVLNDNLVDVMVQPGTKKGDATSLSVAPQTRYVQIMNRVTTSAPDIRPVPRWDRDTARADGTHSVMLTGTAPAGHAPVLKV